jgi:hypothetical protein
VWPTRVKEKHGEPEHEMQEDGYLTRYTGGQFKKESFSDTN